jgi:hypothetical protein
MMSYLGHWQFWVAVVVVTFLVHLALSKLLGLNTAGGAASS